MHDRNTEYVKDILFKSGKLCIICDIKNASDVIKAMQKMTNDMMSSLSSEQMAEMCGILGYTPSRNPQVDTLWQYTKTGIKKTPIDFFVPSDLDAEEIQQFMAEAFQPVSYAILPSASFYKKSKALVQLEGPQASAEFWAKYRQQQMEAPKETPMTLRTPPKKQPSKKRQLSPTIIVKTPTTNNNTKVSKAVESDLLQRLWDQEKCMNELQTKKAADLE